MLTKVLAGSMYWRNTADGDQLALQRRDMLLVLSGGRMTCVCGVCGGCRVLCAETSCGCCVLCAMHDLRRDGLPDAR